MKTFRLQKIKEFFLKLKNGIGSFVSVIGNFFLEWLAALLFALALPLNKLAIFWIHRNRSAFFIKTSNISLQNALAVDKFGNAQYAPLWTVLFVKRSSLKSGDYHPFGDSEETISVAMAKNMKRKSFPLLSWIIAFIMCVLDPKTWFKGGHFHGIADKPRLTKED